MLDTQTGWMIGVGISLLIGAIIAIRAGASAGLGSAVACSLFFPCWVELELFGIPFGIRTTVAAISIVAFAIRHPGRVPSTVVLMDLVVVSLVIIPAVSNAMQGEPIWKSGLMAYGEWALPYILGRYAMRSSRSPEAIGWAVAGVTICLSVAGIIETFTNYSVWTEVFGPRTSTDLIAGKRFGLRRAFGPTDNPLFYGLLITALLPWTLTLIRWSETRMLKAVAWTASVLAVVAVTCTLSRACVGAVVCMGLIMLAFHFPKVRWFLAASAVLVVALLVINPVEFYRSMGEMIGQKSTRRQIEIEGEDVDFNGTMARLWLYRAYTPALIGAGPLGYGAEATDTFPVNVPHLPVSAKTIQELRWIDNAYIFMGLRYGWLGVLNLLLMLGCVFWIGVRLKDDRSMGILATWIAAMFGSMALAMLTVWFAYDFGYAVLWMSGTAAGLMVPPIED